MSRYLFIGGPWDGEWHTIGGGHSHYNVPCIRDFTIIPYSKYDDWEVFPTLPNIVTYSRLYVHAPGWRVWLTMYSCLPYGIRIPTGTILPGSVQGEYLDLHETEGPNAEIARRIHQISKSMRDGDCHANRSVGSEEGT